LDGTPVHPEGMVPALMKNSYNKGFLFIQRKIDTIWEMPQKSSAN
jgi:hypothetical protein